MQIEQDIESLRQEIQLLKEMKVQAKSSTQIKKPKINYDLKDKKFDYSKLKEKPKEKKVEKKDLKIPKEL